VTGIRHKAVLALGLVLFALVMACGDPATIPTGVSIPEPTPDIEATVEAKVQEHLRIEATVEARIEEKQAEDAAPEAKVEAMAKGYDRGYLPSSSYGYSGATHHYCYAYSNTDHLS
jgi:hypothetical protein